MLGATAAQPLAVSAVQVPLKQLLDDRQALVIAQQVILNSLSIIGYAARAPTLAVARSLVSAELVARAPKTGPFIGGAEGALEAGVVPGIERLLSIAQAGKDSGAENYIYNYRNTAQSVLDTLDGVIATYPEPPPKITPKTLSLAPFSPAIRAAVDLEAETEAASPGGAVTPRDASASAASARSRGAREAAGLLALDTAAGAAAGGRDSDAGSVGFGTIAVVSGAALLVWWLATQVKT